jgi:hypothetical protein
MQNSILCELVLIGVFFMYMDTFFVDALGLGDIRFVRMCTRYLRSSTCADAGGGASG